MKRVWIIGMLVAVCALVVGCSGLLDGGSATPDDGKLTAAFTVQHAQTAQGPKVVVRATERADTYTWTWNDGTTTTGGPEAMSATHTYAEPGIYSIGLIVTIAGGNAGGGGGDGGCCGPGPGGPGGGGGTPGEPQTASSHQLVDLTGGSHTLVPVLFFTTGVGGYHTDTFYPGQRVCALAYESKGEQLTYRLEIVRVASVSDPTPIAYPWASSVEYIVTDDPTFCWYIAGPGGCSGEMWTFRVTLRVRDRYWQEATVTKFIFSGCCP